MSWDRIAEVFQATVLSGSLLAAIPVALLAGAISFASPCVLPLVPGYVGYLGGMSGTLGQGVAPGVSLGSSGGAGAKGAGTKGGSAKGRKAGATATATRQRTGQRRLLLGVVLFVLGFSSVFVLLGVTFGWIGLWLAPRMDLITRVLGVVVILMGLAFVGKIPFLQRERRVHLSPRAGLWGAPVLGVVFGLGWMPCIGPTLSAVLLLSLDGGDPLRGALLAAAYCLGLGVPFVVIALLYSRSTRALGFLRRHRVTIMRIGGGVLVLLGLALVTGLWGHFSGWVQGLVADFATVV